MEEETIDVTTAPVADAIPPVETTAINVEPTEVVETVETVVETTASASSFGVGTIVLIVVGVVLAWLAFTYNKLVRLRMRVKEAWSDIEVQLKRRYNLIPNLIETAKGYMTHERETLENVTKARTAAIGNNGTPADQGQTENMLAGALKTLFAVSENYPDLKANQNFLELQRELTDTEDKIQAARRFYNGNVREMNTKVQLFPTNLVAGMLGFKEADFFEVENEEERKNVKVKFDDDTKK
ncbi:LemA family protein [Candidatus Peregrinibacteria bacterium]|jgi:LemA protein|nr:LemA family protein [Candidatus Peregrinibacteria bacterium]MBT7483568.1 LemA family protein [Candidatus Peregrinibacteria bacterium]MBT7703224.1 LemA family protein [Candidatus Peregrinibacteria bacterium]